jgi:hypothetical protein
MKLLTKDERQEFKIIPDYFIDGFIKIGTNFYSIENIEYLFVGNPEGIQSKEYQEFSVKFSHQSDALTISRAKFEQIRKLKKINKNIERFMNALPGIIIALISVFAQLFLC